MHRKNLASVGSPSFAADLISFQVKMLTGSESSNQISVCSSFSAPYKKRLENLHGFYNDEKGGQRHSGMGREDWEMKPVNLLTFCLITTTSDLRSRSLKNIKILARSYLEIWNRLL